MNLSHLKPYITQSEIALIVAKLGAQISKDYEKDSDLVVIVTLKGAILFAADLIRQIKIPMHLDFVRLTSYGSGTESSGNVRILKDIEISPEGKDLLILDEIVDSGRSLALLRDRLKDSGAKSLKFCTLLDKPSGRKVEISVDYVGRTVEDKFLVGYGLDHDEKYRNLADIYSVSS